LVLEFGAASGSGVRMKASVLALCSFILTVASPAQETLPQYITGIGMFSSASCPDNPVFVGALFPISPAASGGLQVGDQLLSIDGESVKGLQDASARMRSSSPSPVLLKVKRSGSIRIFSVAREETATIRSRNDLRLLDDGSVVGMDYTDAEIEEYRSVTRDLERAMQAGDFLNVFPGHYPGDKSLYYPGFEIFVWNKESQVRVGGIENGPAKQSGIRWGDRIVSVNGTDPRGKSLAELESLFSSSHAMPMQLVIERAGIHKTYSFQLDIAARVLTANNWKIVDGKMVPLWLPQAYTKCF
jgi:C-terminal processing protease CtpA/Prc